MLRWGSLHHVERGSRSVTLRSLFVQHPRISINDGRRWKKEHNRFDVWMPHGVYQYGSLDGGIGRSIKRHILLVFRLRSWPGNELPSIGKPTRTIDSRLRILHHRCLELPSSSERSLRGDAQRKRFTGHKDGDLPLRRIRLRDVRKAQRRAKRSNIDGWWRMDRANRVNAAGGGIIDYENSRNSAAKLVNQSFRVRRRCGYLRSYAMRSDDKARRHTRHRNGMHTTPLRIVKIVTRHALALRSTRCGFDSRHFICQILRAQTPARETARIVKSKIFGTVSKISPGNSATTKVFPTFKKNGKFDNFEV